MRTVFAFLFLTSLSIAHAEKPAPPSTSQKPLPTKMDVLTAARLDAAVAKIKHANTLVQQINESVAPAWKVVNEVTSKYKLQLTDAQGRTMDSVNYETGEITRAAPALPPEPTADTVPPKPAKK